MKNTSWYIQLLLFCSISMSCGQESVTVEQIQGGEKQVLKDFYKNGNLKSEIIVTDGVYDGEAKQYYEDGTLANSANFKNDVRVGVNLVYYENGAIKIKEYYNNKGELEGSFEEYFEEGTIKIKGTYSQNQRTGIWKEYYEDNVLYEENTLSANEFNGVQKVYHRNGQLAVVGEAFNGLEEGEWIFLDVDKDTLKIETYRNGEVTNVIKYKESEKGNVD